MSTRFKDGIRRTCVCCNKYELKAINFVVQRKSILDPVNSEVSIKRDLENPEDLVVHIKHGEGQRPIFDRDDICVNEERQIILMNSKRDCLIENGSNEENQHSLESSDVGNNFFDNENLRDLIPSKKSKNRSYSRERRSSPTANYGTSFKRNRSPNSRNIYSSENIEHHRRSRSTSSWTRSLKRRSPYKSGRFHTPSKKKFPYYDSDREYETYKKRSRPYSKSPSSSYKGRSSSPSPYKVRRHFSSPDKEERNNKFYRRYSPPSQRDERDRTYFPLYHTREY